MRGNYTTRHFSLDMMCQQTSSVLESAIWKAGTFTNTIEGRSRGVRLGDCLIRRVFEKKGVSCGKRKTSKTRSKCENVTQVVSRATSNDDQQHKKKVLAPAPVWPKMSHGKWWRYVAEIWPSDFSNRATEAATIWRRNLLRLTKL